MTTKEKKNKYMRKWRVLNPKKARLNQLNSMAKKPEYYKLKNKEKYLRWKKEKPIELKAMQKKASLKMNLKKPWLISNHRPERKKYYKEWVKNNPENMKIIRKRAKAKRKGVEGSYTLSQWELLLKQYGFTCPCCKVVGIELHADHIIPIVKGGSNYIENIQPLCKVCNSRKYTKIIKYAITE